MLGAIAGDIIGSVYEFDNTRDYHFELLTPRSSFTDDTVITIAVAECLLHGGEYAVRMKHYGQHYPNRGYGSNFNRWLDSTSLAPYNSFGNGSAMRVSPIGFAFNTLNDTLTAAAQCAAVTHNHPEGIKGAQAVAAAIFLARRGRDRDYIRDFIIEAFGYPMDKTLDEMRPAYGFDETCQGSVPQAITAFLESGDFEDAIRKAVSLGGDSDTLACITGGIAQAFYGAVPVFIAEEVRRRLEPPLLAVVDEFNQRYRLG